MNRSPQRGTAPPAHDYGEGMVSQSDSDNDPQDEPLNDDDEALETDRGRGRGVLVNGLSSSQEAAIIALLNEPTIPKAAEAARVSKRNLYRWLSEPTFAK